MTSLCPASIGGLLQGSLATGLSGWPLRLFVRLGDLGPAFLPKGQVGRHFRAIARNGRVLLASDLPATAWAGRCARARLQTWHKVILPGSPPEPYGILMCLWTLKDAASERFYEGHLQQAADASLPLCLELGGRRWLGFRRRDPGAEVILPEG